MANEYYCCRCKQNKEFYYASCKSCNHNYCGECGSPRYSVTTLGGGVAMQATRFSVPFANVGGSRSTAEVLQSEGEDSSDDDVRSDI